MNFLIAIPNPKDDLIVARLFKSVCDRTMTGTPI